MGGSHYPQVTVYVGRRAILLYSFNQSVIGRGISGVMTVVLGIIGSAYIN
jgi:hypothetical protein